MRKRSQWTEDMRQVIPITQSSRTIIVSNSK
ncbi:hypothetical protein KIH39_20720 [Telmatocola sphagniphila]|uniref:Uncharacterized protein n=1 Tax=Telmatocola sphagniphila TaxID=1123043 RepID=A0A8E6B315_9BACT|nr:hypothetical protein KIH39_20720 [Telmatocola sphagniphila]